MKRSLFISVMSLLIGLSITAEAKTKRFLVFLKQGQSKQQIEHVMNRHTEKINLSEMSNAEPTKAVYGETLSAIGAAVVSATDDAMLESIKNDPQVLSVHEEQFFNLPNISGHVKDFSPAAHLQSPVQTWGIKAVSAPQAWGPSGGGAGARIAIIDSGIDKDHPALAANFEQGKDFVGDQVMPYAFFDQAGHGTHVAVTAAGVMDKNGFSGVAPRAKILSGRVCDGDGQCSDIAVAEGISWAIEQKVDVINLSLGSEFSSPIEKAAIEKAIQAGVVVVAAAGNEGQQNKTVSFPGAFDGVIAVGAVDSTLTRASFSNTGAKLAVVAPGVDVISAVPQGSGRYSDLRVSQDGVNFSIIPTKFMAGLVAGSTNSEVVDCGTGTAVEYVGCSPRGKMALVSFTADETSDTKITKLRGAMIMGVSALILYEDRKTPRTVAMNVDDAKNFLMADQQTPSVPTFPFTLMFTDISNVQQLQAKLSAKQKVISQYQVIKTDYVSNAGTSMASPHVTGVVALMRAANKNISVADIKTILQRTARPATGTDPMQYGAGLVNAQAAVQAALAMKIPLQ